MNLPTSGSPGRKGRNHYRSALGDSPTPAPQSRKGKVEAGSNHSRNWYGKRSPGKPYDGKLSRTVWGKVFVGLSNEWKQGAHKNKRCSSTQKGPQVPIPRSSQSTIFCRKPPEGADAPGGFAPGGAADSMLGFKHS
jgi:hypothetical protein